MACHLKLGDIIIDDETRHNMIVTLNCMVLFLPYVQSTMSCHMTGFEFLLKQIHIQESMNSSQTNWSFHRAWTDSLHWLHQLLVQGLQNLFLRRRFRNLLALRRISDVNRKNNTQEYKQNAHISVHRYSHSREAFYVWPYAMQCSQSHIRRDI